MIPVIFKEADKIWKRVARDSHEDDLQFELEIHKKLLQFFQVGDYYYYIFNVPEARFDFLSSEIKQVLGYDPSEMDIRFFLNIIHPDDQPEFLNIENAITDFMQELPEDQVPHYKARYDYRIRKKSGEYIRILQQIVTVQYDREKGIARTFGVHTDISHIKMEGQPVLSFIGLDGAPSYINVKPKQLYTNQNLYLSNREKQILMLLVEGHNTASISEKLFISELTVKTHRKNILRKTNSTNTASLVSNAIKKGWI